MQIALPELDRPAILRLDSENLFNDDEYFEFCVANPDLNVERTSQGEIVIVPPPGGESDFRNVEVISELHVWAKRDRQGLAFGATVQFILPDGAALSPDAAWVSNERIGALTKQELRKFLHLVPEFVIEVLSPGDRLSTAKKKMCQWAANGVELGWLIDGDNRTVYVYRGTGEPRVIAGAESVAGEGLVERFVLPLIEIREGPG